MRDGATMKPEEVLKRLASECFYIDSEGCVGWNFDESFNMQSDMPELAEALKPYITENWQKKG